MSYSTAKQKLHACPDQVYIKKSKNISNELAVQISTVTGNRLKAYYIDNPKAKNQFYKDLSLAQRQKFERTVYRSFTINQHLQKNMEIMRERRKQLKKALQEQIGFQADEHATDETEELDVFPDGSDFKTRKVKDYSNYDINKDDSSSSQEEEVKDFGAAFTIQHNTVADTLAEDHIDMSVHQKSFGKNNPTTTEVSGANSTKKRAVEDDESDASSSSGSASSGSSSSGSDSD